MYVELAPAGSTPIPGTAGALLRSYLGILAYYLRQPGADCSAGGISDALSMLPGLVTQSIQQVEEEFSVPPSSSSASGLAAILASGWSVAANSPKLLSLVRPMAAGSGSSATLIVLQRPANDVPTLEILALTATLQQGQAQPIQHPPTLSMTGWRTTCTVRDDTLASALAFVADLNRQGRIADLAKTPGYVAIPLG
jgi:hypothetical protein